MKGIISVLMVNRQFQIVYMFLYCFGTFAFIIGSSERFHCLDRFKCLILYLEDRLLEWTELTIPAL